tara:strand:- start:2247 stop:2867 length:621 start_codon:yes stop_codon:yes gene_type:complete
MLYRCNDLMTDRLIRTLRFAIMLMVPAASVNAAGGGSEGGWIDRWLLSYDLGLFFWTIITFFIVLFILKAKAWGPLMEALDKREQDIKEALSAADRAKTDAENAQAEYEQIVQKAREEAQGIVSESRKAGDTLKADIENTARENAQNMVEKAKGQIEAERDKVLSEMREVAVDLSIKAAEKVIRKNLTSEDNKKLAEETVNQLGQA